MRFRCLLAACAAIATMLPASASADSFQICNTGQAAGCIGTIAGGAQDVNYTIIAGPQGPLTQAAIDDGYPIPPWMANDADSKWITWFGADDNSNGTFNGIYTYRTTFDLTGYDASSAKITGLWGTDDAGLDIKINGISVGAGQLSGGFTSLTAFMITTGFISGINTLDFTLINSGGGPTGLRVDNISGTANAVPEPATLTLVGLGGLAAVRRRLRRR